MCVCVCCVWVSYLVSCCFCLFVCFVCFWLLLFGLVFFLVFFFGCFFLVCFGGQSASRNCIRAAAFRDAESYISNCTAIPLSEHTVYFFLSKVVFLKYAKGMCFAVLGATWGSHYQAMIQ